MSARKFICPCCCTSVPVGMVCLCTFSNSLVVEQNVSVEMVYLGASIVLHSFLIVPCAYIG